MGGICGIGILWTREEFIHVSVYVVDCVHSRCSLSLQCYPFSALTLLVAGRKGIRPVKTEWWVAGMVICLERGADLHMAQLMSLPLIVSCFSKIQIGFTFLRLAHLGSPGKRAIKRVCVCVFVSFCLSIMIEQDISESCGWNFVESVE